MHSDRLRGGSDAGEGRTFFRFITATLAGKFISLSLTTDHRPAWKLELAHTSSLIRYPRTSSSPTPVLVQSLPGGSAAQLAACSSCSSKSMASPAQAGDAQPPACTSVLRGDFSCLFLRPLVAGGASRLLMVPLAAFNCGGTGCDGCLMLMAVAPLPFPNQGLKVHLEEQEASGCL